MWSWSVQRRSSGGLCMWSIYKLLTLTRGWWSWRESRSRGGRSAQAPPPPGGRGPRACAAWGGRKRHAGCRAGSHQTCSAGSAPQAAGWTPGWWPGTGGPDTSWQTGSTDTCGGLSLVGVRSDVWYLYWPWITCSIIVKMSSQPHIVWIP